MATDREIINKLFKIAKNQQKIIEKLAQNNSTVEQKLRSVAKIIIQYTKEWLKNKVDLGIVEISPKITQNELVEISLKAKTDEAYKVVNSQTGAYKSYITPLINKYLPNYTIFVYVYGPEGNVATEPYNPEDNKLNNY